MPILGKKGYFYGYLGNAYGDKQIMKCEEKISHHSILETFVHISTTMWQLCLTSEILTFLWFFTAPPGRGSRRKRGGTMARLHYMGRGGIRSSKYQLLQFKWKDFLGLTMFFRQKKRTIPLKKKWKICDLFHSTVKDILHISLSLNLFIKILFRLKILLKPPK